MISSIIPVLFAIFGPGTVISDAAIKLLEILIESRK